MSQSSLIAEYLRSGRTLTALEALELFGCFRLGARCYDLRREGYDVRAEMVRLANGKRVAQYRLASTSI